MVMRCNAMCIVWDVECIVHRFIIEQLFLFCSHKMHRWSSLALGCCFVIRSLHCNLSSIRLFSILFHTISFSCPMLDILSDCLHCRICSSLITIVAMIALHSSFLQIFFFDVALALSFSLCRHCEMLLFAITTFAFTVISGWVHRPFFRVLQSTHTQLASHTTHIYYLRAWRFLFAVKFSAVHRRQNTQQIK